MKASGGLALLLFAFLLFSSSFARPLSTTNTQVVLGGGKPEADGNLVIEATDLSDLMGMEAEEESCGDQDEECLKRRMIAEAHLDYIYTQKHKP
ncbi:putative phytosulfokines 6 [Eucalyptus grandis]|nr:putative phytosulfokines 6 [Eucalyptus grandis]